jgi:hypothetical protein
MRLGVCACLNCNKTNFVSFNQFLASGRRTGQVVIALKEHTHPEPDLDEAIGERTNPKRQSGDEPTLVPGASFNRPLYKVHRVGIRCAARWLKGTRGRTRLRGEIRPAMRVRCARDSGVGMSTRDDCLSSILDPSLQPSRRSRLRGPYDDAPMVHSMFNTRK